MAVDRQPVLKRCKALGISPMVLGYSKETNRHANANNRKKVSEYGMQLKEKQKLKFIYGVLEKQFYHYYEMAVKMDGVAGENLIKILESRLDNVVFRMGMAITRREARQLVTHGHFTVNGKKVDVPSYRIKPGDVVAVSETSKKSIGRCRRRLAPNSWYGIASFVTSSFHTISEQKSANQAPSASARVTAWLALFICSDRSV